MSVRSSRWLLLAVLFIAVPVPTPGPFGASAPPFHYWSLFLASAAVGAAEGADGPLPMILMMLGLFAIAATLVALTLAWLGARLLELVSPAWQRGLLFAGIAVWLAIALAFDVYATPLGPALRTNLIGVLS